MTPNKVILTRLPLQMMEQYNGSPRLVALYHRPFRRLTNMFTSTNWLQQMIGTMSRCFRGPNAPTHFSTEG